MTKTERDALPLRATFDRNTGAAYIYVRDPIRRGEVKRTVPDTTAEVYLDYDENEVLVGIEVLVAPYATTSAEE